MGLPRPSAGHCTGHFTKCSELVGGSSSCCVMGHCSVEESAEAHGLWGWNQVWALQPCTGLCNTDPWQQPKGSVLHPAGP